MSDSKKTLSHRTITRIIDTIGKTESFLIRPLMSDLHRFFQQFKTIK